MNKVNIDRRRFVKILSWGAGVFALGFPVSGMAKGLQGAPDCDFFQPGAFLRIDKNGQVTIFFAKQESGQGVNTSLPMIVAEELDVDFAQVKTEFAPFGTLPEGAHDTGGSGSVTGGWDELRKAGAVARAMLVQAAAMRWNIGTELCKTENGKVVNALNSAYFSYGELVCDAAALPVPETVTLKNVADFKVVGKEQRKKNLKDILTGKAQYGIDIDLPGMLYAVVLRCPVLGGKLVSCDDTAALALPGVVKVVRYEGTGSPMHVRAGVAVIARHYWTAQKARNLLKVVWDEGADNRDSTDALFQEMAEKAVGTPRQIIHTAGNVDSLNGKGVRSLTATYAAPLLAHATIEPVNFIAEVKNGKCTLWGGLQLPDWAVSSVADSCGIKKEDIKVNLSLMGGAFGRRLQSDFTIEAVKIAQQIDAPVKVVWDRADDLQFDNYRPANYHRLQAKWNKEKQVLAWEHHVLTTPIAYMVESPEAKDPSEMLGGAHKDFWYDVPNVRTAYTPVDINVHRGWLRGVEPVVNVFAVECFIDEIAHKLKKDPLDFRLSLLKGRAPFEAKFSANWGQTVDPGRLAGVLELAADKIGWRQPRPKNHFVGIAGHLFFCDSYAAHAIEIELLGPKKFRLVKIVIAMDCGLVVNPDGLRNQLEGGTVFGLGQALRNEITVHNSRVDQDSFFKYELARFDDIPPIEAYTVESQAKPGGAGEVAVATVAPALCNALAAAGYRPRTLPIKKEGFTWAPTRNA